MRIATISFHIILRKWHFNKFAKSPSFFSERTIFRTDKSMPFQYVTQTFTYYKQKIDPSAGTSISPENEKKNKSKHYQGNLERFTNLLRVIIRHWLLHIGRPERSEMDMTNSSDVQGRRQADRKYWKRIGEASRPRKWIKSGLDVLDAARSPVPVLPPLRRRI